MSLGKVQINRLNLMQGALPEIERHFLFIGLGDTNVAYEKVSQEKTVLY